MLLAGQKVYVGPFLKKSDRPVDRESHFTNVYVKNLPDSVNDEKLNEMFSEHGSVTSAVVMKVVTVFFLLCSVNIAVATVMHAAIHCRSNPARQFSLYVKLSSSMYPQLLCAHVTQAEWLMLCIFECQQKELHASKADADGCFLLSLL